MKAYSTLTTELDGRLLEVRLNRPQKRNAFTVQMSDELEDVFRLASRDDRVGDRKSVV